MGDRGVHRDVRRRRQGVRRRDRRENGSVHAGARRTEPEAPEQREQLRRCVGGRGLSTEERRRFPAAGRARAQGPRASSGDRAALHEMGRTGGGPMIALVRREFHLFTAAGKNFLYLVPSAAIFALDDATSAVLRT